MIRKIMQGILLAALFVYIFYGLEIDNINFNKFSPWGLFISFFIIFFSQIILSIRWMKMSQLSFKISFETIIVSSALNMILPAKLGELSKAVYLKKFYQYNYHKSVSIILVERFFDIIVLFLLLCLWVYSYASNELLQYAIIVLSLLIFSIIIFFYSHAALKYLKKIPLQFLRVYLQKIFRVVNKMFRSPLSLSFYTLLLWAAYFSTTIIFYSLGAKFQLDFSALLGLFIFSTVALSIPLAPAGLGTYEGAIILFLGSYGISKEDALLAATLYHILLFMVDFILLYIFILLKNIKLGELLKS